MLDIKGLIYSCMRTTNEVMGEEHWTMYTPDTGIMNHVKGETMNSIDFVGFLMLLEDRIFERAGRSIKLMASGRVFTLADSPFRTVATLAGFVEGMLV